MSNNKNLPMYLNGHNQGVPFNSEHAIKILNSPNVTIRSVYDGSYFTPYSIPTSNTLIPGSYRPGQTYHVALYTPQTMEVWYHGK